MASNLDYLAGVELDKRMAEVKRNLIKELGVTDPQRVAEVVDAERHRFDDARIHAFLPILIERFARERLIVAA